MDAIPDGRLILTAATACEANLHAWVPVFGTLGAVLTDNPPGVYRAVTPYRNPLFNSVMAARLTPDTVDAAIEQVKADASARRITILWWLRPSSKPADLAERLVQHGFTVDGEAPGMTIDLGQMNESLPAPAGLSIERAQDDKGRRHWVEAMYGGFGAPVPPTDEITADPWYVLLGRVPADRVQAFTAYLAST